MADLPEKNKWRVNRKPRFTALELGEYMAADDGPRETLIRDLKYERLARSLVYRTLNQAVASFLVSPTRDRRILVAARETLVAERDASQNPRQRENIVYELRALDAFEASLNALSLTGWTLERVPVGGHRLDVEGVRISVRPTVRIRLRKLRGADQVGALLVDVAKGQAPKTDESAARVANAMTHSAIVLHQYVVDTLPDRPLGSPLHLAVLTAEEVLRKLEH